MPHEQKSTNHQINNSINSPGQLVQSAHHGAWAPRGEQSIAIALVRGDDAVASIPALGRLGVEPHDTAHLALQSLQQIGPRWTAVVAPVAENQQHRVAAERDVIALVESLSAGAEVGARIEVDGLVRHHVTALERECAVEI